jgi:hypothetical protein
VEAHRRAPVRDLCDRVVEQLLGPAGNEDDAAIIVVRRASERLDIVSV